MGKGSTVKEEMARSHTVYERYSCINRLIGSHRAPTVRSNRMLLREHRMSGKTSGGENENGR